MLYLHRLLPIFVLPVSITLMLILAGLLFRRRALIWAGLILLWICSTPLLGDLALRAAEGWAERLEAADVAAADAIVVLSGGQLVSPRKNSLSEWQLGDRFYSGLALFRAGKAPLLVFTGAWLPWQPQTAPEGKDNAAAARTMGVPGDKIVVTGRVSNTAEEARAVADSLLARRQNAGRKPNVLLVTSAYHMPRARSLLQRAGLSVYPFPVDFRVSPPGGFHFADVLPSAEALRQTEIAWREMYGRLYYFIFR